MDCSCSFLRAFLSPYFLNHSDTLSLNYIWMLRRLFHVDSPERPCGIDFVVLQSFLDAISTRVWKSYSMVLDWVGQTAPADSRKLPGSFRSTEQNRWNLALCHKFHFLGRQLVYQLQVDHRRIFWRYRIQFDGDEQRSTILNVRRRPRYLLGQLRNCLRRWILVWLLRWCSHNDVSFRKHELHMEDFHRLHVLELHRSCPVVLVSRIRRWRSPDNTCHKWMSWMDHRPNDSGCTGWNLLVKPDFNTSKQDE